MYEKIFKKYRYSAILLRELVITDFKLRYQGSALGYLWSLLRPLFLFVILYVVFVYFLKIGKGIEHWPVALLLGIVVWNFFAEITNQGLKAVVNQGGLLRKINFPKYIIIIAASFSALINLVLNLIVVVVFMAVNGVEVGWGMLLAPLFILEVYVFGLGLAFILSTLYVKFRDTNYIWEIIMQALFYGSAVIYPIIKVSEMNESLAQVILLNPVAQAIQDIRHFAVSTDMPTLATISQNINITFIPFVVTIGVFIAGALIFKKRSPYFAEDV